MNGELMNRRSLLASGLAAGALGALSITGANSLGSGLWANPRVRHDDVELSARALPILGFAQGSSFAALDPTNLSRTLDVFTASRAGGLRFDIPWYFIQNKKNLFTWDATDAVVNAINNRGAFALASIVTCPPWAAANSSGYQWTRPKNAADYATFCGQVAQRYRGKIDAYEIWNEPNGALFFSPNPDPVFYTSMVRAAYPKIKAADSSVTVLAGALGSTGNTASTVSGLDFLTAMYANSVGPYCDAISNHPYEWNFTSTFADGMRYDTAPIRQMIKMRELMVSKGDSAKKIWLTEFGAPTIGDVTQEKQNNLIFNCIQQWQGVSYGGPMFIHMLRDIATGSTDSEDNFGVATSTYTPKTALYGIEALGRNGYPKTQAFIALNNNADPALGAPIGPAYPLSTGWALECENGARFLTNTGYFSSPPAVALVARTYNLLPISAFANGMQDMNLAGGLRVFSRSDVGTHPVYGAILTAWTPEIGFPTTDTYSVAGTASVACDFENGKITWAPTGGTVVTWTNG